MFCFVADYIKYYLIGNRYFLAELSIPRQIIAYFVCLGDMASDDCTWSNIIPNISLACTKHAPGSIGR